MTPITTRRDGTGVFVAQLHRAAAQRGKLDPVYQELSDHWTAILQRLYPVWALIGPGLSDPGHIEIHSRQIYLDSTTLLGTREQILAGALEARAVLRCFGVALHETFHAKHTTRWAIEHDLTLSHSENPDDRQLAVDRRLLEEPRMEAHGVREHPADTLRGQFVRHALGAAVTDVILPQFAQQLCAAGAVGMPLSRDTAGRATVYLHARTHYGIVDPAVLGGLREVWRRSWPTGTSMRWTPCSPGSSGSLTATLTLWTAPPGSTARSSERPTHPQPTGAATRPAMVATGPPAATASTAATAVSPRPARWATR